MSKKIEAVERTHEEDGILANRIDADLGKGGCQKGHQRQHGGHHQGEFPVLYKGNDKPSNENRATMKEVSSLVSYSRLDLVNVTEGVFT